LSKYQKHELDPTSPRIPQILSHPGFVPLEGDIADVIREKIRSKLKVSIPERELDDAVASLGALHEPELIGLASMQDSYCIKCGNCCRTQTPINMTRIEMKRIASHLKLKRRRLTKLLKPRYREGGTFDIPAKPCPLLSENSCTVYPVRPFTCRTYPFGHTLASFSSQKMHTIPSDCPAAVEMMAFLGTTRLVVDLMIKKGDIDILAEVSDMTMRRWGAGTPSQQIRAMKRNLLDNWTNDTSGEEGAEK